MSDHAVISNSAVRRRVGFTLIEVAIVVAIVALLVWLLWLKFGAPAPGVLNPIISAVAPAGSTVTVDVYGAFTRAPTTLGNTSFRTDFKLIAVPPGTTVNAGMRLPAGVTATPLGTIPVTFSLGGPVQLVSTSPTALTPATTAQGVASISIRASGTARNGTVTATVTIGGKTGTETVTFEVDRSTSSQ